MPPAAGTPQSQGRHHLNSKEFLTFQHSNKPAYNLQAQWKGKSQNSIVTKLQTV